MLLSKRVLRFLWLANFAILLTVLLPALLNHPYPRPFRPYIQWGGLVFYLVSGFWLLAISAKQLNLPSK